MSNTLSIDFSSLYHPAPRTTISKEQKFMETLLFRRKKVGKVFPVKISTMDAELEFSLDYKVLHLIILLIIIIMVAILIIIVNFKVAPTSGNRFPRQLAKSSLIWSAGQ